MALEALFDAVIVKSIEVEETTYGNNEDLQQAYGRRYCNGSLKNIQVKTTLGNLHCSPITMLCAS